MNIEGNHIHQRLEDELSIKRTISYYLNNWKWFAISLGLALFIAFIYLRYTTKEYESTGLIRLITLNNNPSPEEAILGELGLVYGGEKLHTDEIQILKSRGLIEEVVKTLDFNIQVFPEGTIKDSELYHKSPIRVNLFAADTVLYNFETYLEIVILSETEFEFTDEYGVESIKLFGSKIHTGAGPLVILPSEMFDLERYKGQRLKILVSPIDRVAGFYRDKLSVYSYSDRVNRSNMIGITITDPVPEKATVFVNTLIDTYNQRSIENKSEIAKNTYDFINERATGIANELSEVDLEKESFKVGNMLTDVGAEAGIFVQAEAANEIELFEVETKLNTIDYIIKRYLDQNVAGSFPTFPANLGLEDASISELSSNYNRIVLQRNRILSSSGEKNPVVLQLNDQLIGLQNSLRQSLENLRNALKIKQSNLRSQSEMISSRISSVPGQERETRNIQREQNTKESIYLYLLQKKEEAAITMYTAYPSAEVIDRAKINKVPVHPKRSLVILASGVIGLLIPFSILFAVNFLDTKIKERRDLVMVKALAHFGGEIPKTRLKSLKPADTEALKEAMRLMRTNLDFTNSKDGSRVIFVTSSINGEGKSFIASQLALVYAASGKKVLLVGGDIRKPNLHEFISIKGDLGLSDYLRKQGADLEQVIHRSLASENLWMLHSGTIPPNPAELLLSEKLKDLFVRLRSEFDIIVVDTAPTTLVTDTFIVSKYADQIVYLVRAGYTEKEVLQHIAEIISEGKLNNVHMVLNDVAPENLRYSGKYGGKYSYKLNAGKEWQKKILEKVLP